MLFALEPNSAIPSTPTLEMQMCAYTPTGYLLVKIIRNGEVENHLGAPVGMFADGGLHEIAVSISRKSHTITYYLDQKIMSTNTYVYDNGYGSGGMPTFAVGKVFIGDSFLGPSFIGRMKNAYIETDKRLPYQDKYKVLGFNERGYGSCIG